MERILFIKKSPTSFAPIIRKAIGLVSARREYHILIIIADGAVDDMDETINAIVEASNYPLSIVCIGVGKGLFYKKLLCNFLLKDPFQLKL